MRTFFKNNKKNTPEVNNEHKIKISPTHPITGNEVLYIPDPLRF